MFVYRSSPVCIEPQESVQKIWLLHIVDDHLDVLLLVTDGIDVVVCPARRV